VSRLRIVAPALFVLLVPALAMASEEAGGHESKLFWHALNLALVLAVLLYFARTPVRTYMAERRQSIEAGIEAARRQLAEAERQLAECNERMASLDHEVEEIRRAPQAAGTGAAGAGSRRRHCAQPEAIRCCVGEAPGRSIGCAGGAREEGDPRGGAALRKIAGPT